MIMHAYALCTHTHWDNTPLLDAKCAKCLRFGDCQDGVLVECASRGDQWNDRWLPWKGRLGRVQRCYPWCSRPRSRCRLVDMSMSDAWCWRDETDAVISPHSARISSDQSRATAKLRDYVTWTMNTMNRHRFVNLNLFKHRMFALRQGVCCKDYRE